MLLVCVQISVLNAMRYGLKRIFFGGFFIRGHDITMDIIAFAINFWYTHRPAAPVPILVRPLCSNLIEVTQAVYAWVAVALHHASRSSPTPPPAIVVV